MAEDMKEYTLILRFKADPTKGTDLVGKSERVFAAIDKEFKNATLESYTIRTE